MSGARHLACPSAGVIRQRVSQAPRAQYCRFPRPLKWAGSHVTSETTYDGINAMSLAEPEVEDARIGRTVALLGGRGALYRSIVSRLEAHDLLQEGLPGYALDHLVHHVAILRAPHHGNLEKAVGVSLRTYQRKQESLDKPLSPEQSGRTWKFAEILGRATEVFGSQDEAEQWLERPAMGLDERRPIDLLSSPVGVETLEDHLTRLEYGVYA